MDSRKSTQSDRPTIRKADQDDFENISILLELGNLPTNDLLTSKIEFLVAEKNARIIGCVGLEYYLPHALLRSLIVHPHFQKQGIAKLLIEKCFQLVKEQHVGTLHLLTTTAKDYFLKHGFQLADRSTSPMSIQNTPEFSLICPSSASYLVYYL